MSKEKRLKLDADQPIWDRFFLVAPLVLVGTREEDGSYDLAPKHMAAPMGWDNYFGFVCTPEHRTYHNARREEAFTVSFPRPTQIVLASLAATPRCDDQSKPSLAALPTFPATEVDGPLLEDAYVHLECRLHKVYDDYGRNSLITGRIVLAQVAEAAVRGVDRDDADILVESPLLAYLQPGRYARVGQSFAFPYSQELV